MRPNPLTSFLYAISLSFNAFAEPADDLLVEKEHLVRSLKASGSFIATYELQNDNGDIMLFETGAHFKSGWAYLRGTVIGKRLPADRSWWERLVEMTQLSAPVEIYANPAGSLVIAKGGHGTIFEGHPKFLEDFRKLKARLLPLSDGEPFHAFPVLIITKDTFDASIQMSAWGPSTISSTERIVKMEDDTTTLSGSGLGEITVDRKSGLVISQLNNSKNVPRTLKLTHLEKNPGWLAISKKITPPSKHLKAQAFQESLMARGLLFQILQNLVIHSEPIDLRTHLILQEKSFIRFMRRHPDGKSLLKEEFLSRLIQQHLDQIAQRIKKPPHEVIQDDGFKNISLRTLATEIEMNKRPVNNEQITASLLGRPLLARNPTMQSRKKIVEGFVTHCIYRTELEIALEAYRKDFE